MRKSKQQGISFSVGRWNDKEQKGVSLSTYWKKRKIFDSIQVHCREKGQVYLRVNYNNSYYNDGVYTTQKDAKEAFSIFIEQCLINYALRKV